MWFWKNKKDKKKKDVVISHSCYTKLPLTHQQHFSPAESHHSVTHEVVHHDDSGSNFGLSLLVAEATGNPMLGYLAGGDLMGAAVGESMADSGHTEFGGGDTGGGGAGGDFSSPNDSGSSSDSSSSYDSGSSSSFDN